MSFAYECQDQLYFQNVYHELSPPLPLLQFKLTAEGEIGSDGAQAKAAGDDAMPSSPQAAREEDTCAPMSIVRQQPPSSVSRFGPSHVAPQLACPGPAATASSDGWGSLLSFLTNQDPNVISSCQKPRGAGMGMRH